MPTRYRPALARGETTQQGEEETQWKGMGMTASSVCTTIGRLTFTPKGRFCWPLDPTTALDRLFAVCA
jgi:hypothetical protein